MTAAADEDDEHGLADSGDPGPAVAPAPPPYEFQSADVQVAATVLDASFKVLPEGPGGWASSSRSSRITVTLRKPLPGN